MYYSRLYQNRVYKRTPGGAISFFAGNGTAGTFTEGSIATNTSIYPTGIATDSNNNIYIIDGYNTFIRKVNSSNVVTTVAGGSSTGSISATSIALGPNQNLYLLEDYRVRRVDLASGNIYPFAGTGTAGYSPDGSSAISALLNTSWGAGVAVDNQNNIFITEQNAIRMISGCITDITNSFVSGGSNLCQGSSATLSVTTIPSGATYQWYSGTPQFGSQTIIAGATSSTYSVTNTSSVAGQSQFFVKITSSCGVINSPVFHLYNFPTTSILNQPSPSLQTLMQNSTPTPINVSAGNNGLISYQWYKSTVDTNSGGTPVGAPQSGDISSTINPITTDPPGSYYYYATATQCGTATSNTSAITLTPFSLNQTNHVITKIAGAGVTGTGTDNVDARLSTLNSPTDVVVDGNGNVFIADKNNHKIRKVDQSGTISTYAGNGTLGFSGDGGSALAATLNNPTGLALDNAGNLYITDQGNHRIRRIDAVTGIISTIAGTGIPGFNGDNISAISANLNSPSDIELDEAGNIFIADKQNYKVRKIAANGIITTVYTATGPIENIDVSYDNAYLYFLQKNCNCIIKIDLLNSQTSIVVNPGNTLLNPISFALDISGNTYYTTAGNKIMELLPNNTTVSIAGTGATGSSGDGGFAATATFNGLARLAFDNKGNLYVTDNNHVVRKIWSCFQYINPPPVNPSQLNQSICKNGVASNLNATTTGGLSYEWFSNSISSNIGGSAVPTSGYPYLGENTPIFTPPTSSVGIISYYPKITGSCGTMIGNVYGNITVNPTTSITSHPSTTTVSVCEGTAIQPLSVSATGTGTLTYQWYWNGTPTYPPDNLLYAYIVNGATSSTYTPNIVGPISRYYFAVVHSQCGQDVKSGFSGAITIKQSTYFSIEPSTNAQQVPLGSTPTAISARAQVSGDPYTYQWYVEFPT